MKKKRWPFLLLISGVALFSPFLTSAYYAEFLVEPAALEFNLAPGATAAQSFMISLDPDFEYYTEGEAPYLIESYDDCLEYDENDECVAPVPNLCPYLSFSPTDGEEEEMVSEWEIVGQLFTPGDLTDTWQISVTAPPAEEIASPGETYKCYVEVHSAEFPDPIFAPPGTNQSVDPLNPPNIVEVSAMFGGAAGTLENGSVEPEIGTASSTPFIFTVNYSEAGPVNLVVNDAMFQMAGGGSAFTLEKQFPTGDYEYHFETASGARFPETGELTFRSGLFVTPKNSANLRSAPGTSSSVIGSVGHDQVFELLPLNQQLDVYEQVNNHYWLKGKVGNLVGFVAEDLLMTIIPASQPERVKAKMAEVFNNGDYSDLHDVGFPLELLLAMSSEESDRTLNNEVTSPDSPFGGIMQVHPSGSGGRNDNCQDGTCRKVSGTSGWEGLEASLEDLFGVSINQNNGIAYLFKNYINTSYPNTRQGLEANIKDGLAVLEEDKLYWCNLWDNQFHWQPVTWDGYTISVNELKQICATWLYNGKSYAVEKQYLKRIGEKLETLSSVFPGTVYANEDNLIEKLQIANDHRAEIKVKSPVELRVKDQDSHTTGLVGGSEVNEIPNAVYDEIAEAVVVFFPEGELTYEVKGTSNGSYGLDITETDGEEEKTFSAPAIPITEGAVHRIALNDEGNIATIEVDEDDDGVFESDFVVNPADTAPPEFEVYFDFDTHRVFINGTDNFPGVEKTSLPSKTTFTDAVGHTLEVNWSVFDFQPQRVSLGISSLVYNGATMTFSPPATLTYEWWENAAGRLIKLESRGQVPGQQEASSVYKLTSSNSTTYFQKNRSGQAPISQNMPGPAALRLSTRGGMINFAWPGLVEPWPTLEIAPILND